MSVMPGQWERAELPLDLARRLGELGLVGDGIEDYGCPPMSTVAAGLIQMELSRGDGSLGTLLGVQAGLAMRSIAAFGSEQQKQRWLPPMARMEALWAFALTEPDHGSDSARGSQGRGPSRTPAESWRRPVSHGVRGARPRGRGVRCGVDVLPGAPPVR
jgi:alkylation response protein AidB-like acyl-CoA dehydrogenase